MKRRAGTFALVFVGLVLPIATLVYGWAYASVREGRVKHRLIAELEARGDLKDAEYERNYAKWHERIEGTALASLTVLVVVSAWATWTAVRKQRELSEKKTAFVAAVTHELRTPLTTLRMHAEMLEQNLVPPERTARVYSELVRETGRLSRLIENVLAMSKLEEGRWGLEKKSGDLAATVEAVVDSIRPRAKELGFELHFRAEPERDPIAFDARAVELVTQNLVDNALKYASDAEPREVEITVSGSEIAVRDHGPGISADRRERVFDRFDRAGASEKPGSGLGLALVRELARAHGGDARILDVPRGTKVSVSFPRG